MKTLFVLWIVAIGVLALSMPATGQTFQVLHTFTAPPADAPPAGPLSLDSHGNLLFGSTLGGESTECGSSGCGAVLELSKGYSRWKESVLFSFDLMNGSSVDISGPMAVDAAGNIYGTQSHAGNPLCNCGSVFQLTQTAGVWSQNLLHSFAGGADDGMYPESFMRDSAGNLYGSTVSGGINNNGIIFELTPNSDGTWSYSVIHNFAYGSNNFDGSIPAGPLTIDSHGNLYGTTVGGGLWGYGIVFRLAPAAGVWNETILFNFPLDFGSIPQPWGVVADAAGSLYGTTITGGGYGLGTIYRLTPAFGFWNRTILHTFTGSGDGGYASGGLVMDASGALYGATNLGGSFGFGNVYKFTRVSGQWKLTALHEFTNGTDGSRPGAGVVVDWRRNVYGATYAGGASGYGVAFEITQ